MKDGTCVCAEERLGLQTRDELSCDTCRKHISSVEVSPLNACRAVNEEEQMPSQRCAMSCIEDTELSSLDFVL